MNEQRRELFRSLIDIFDQGCFYVNTYDEQLHDYNGVVLYQTESQFIHAVGEHPGVTITELAGLFQKTTSACSQLMKKMRDKGWLRQERNKENNREYNLYLTETGQQIYAQHDAVEKASYERTLQALDNFTEDEIYTYIRIQNALNQTFQSDIQESQEKLKESTAKRKYSRKQSDQKSKQ